ncbi:wee-1.3 [Pristionchus pacificus]|uniref:non-specific serine/threonine protein kinase n=1 Tax=Pristionchus pacificus TaxID=54126 RepID=A0A2A6C6E4_PRIPA|nr:wee-1.3 [Pristionchus pacificus]|eukprot:PDM73782.1 wee-1.3 [Pristionchus pacificus]
MNISLSSTDSARLPDYPMVSPDNRQQLTVEPLSTKRERMESSQKSRFGSDERFFSRVVRSAPVVQRLKHRVAPHAHAIIFHTPPNTPNSPSPVEMEKSDSAYCKTDHECISVPIESEHYDTSKRATYFEQCFIIQTKLGEGSFGEVFQAKSREDNKLYAVKRAIEPYRSTSDRALKLREVQKHEELTPHPNLVYFHRAWEERGRLYIQTELCTASLADICKYDAPPKNEIWDIFYDVINATDYLHSKDLIHLDIKPENIFLTDKKVCKLGDFGLMFDLKHDHMATVEEGDSKYLAPEVLNNPPTQAADIFSIGMSILEVSTNLDLPTTGENWHALRSRRVPERFLTILDPDMRRLILWMIDPVPERRPTTKELINDPAVYWPFLKRSSTAEISQMVSIMSIRFTFLSTWACLLWRLITSPIHRLGQMLAHARRKRTRAAPAVMEVTSTPEQKRQRNFETSSPIDYDSNYSDEEEDPHHKLMSARCIADQFYSESPLRLQPSLSPFKEYDANRERKERQRLREERCASPTTFASPASPLFVHEGGAASAPVIGRRRAARAAAATRDSAAAAVQLRARLQLDSDSDEGDRRKKEPKTPKTPQSASLSAATRQFRRSALRTLDSPRARKLDFSILDDDDEQDPTEQENDAAGVPVCRTPSPSGLRHRLAAGDA